MAERSLRIGELQAQWDPQNGRGRAAGRLCSLQLFSLCRPLPPYSSLGACWVIVRTSTLGGPKLTSTVQR